jgi:hypothetical protein
MHLLQQLFKQVLGTVCDSVELAHHALDSLRVRTRAP